MAKPTGKTARLEEENESLRARLEALEESLEHMSHGLCVFDADGRIVLSNRAYADVLDLPPEKLFPGMTSQQQIELGIAAGHYPAELDMDELMRRMWTNLTCPDEERKSFGRGDNIISVYPAQTPSGNIVCTFEDITARTRVEEALRDSEARLSAILDVMPECIKIFDEGGNLTYINPKGLELLEAPDLQTLNATERLVVPEEYHELCMLVHRRVLAGESVNWTYELIGLKGRRCIVEANAVPFRLPDGSRAHLCISRDVSERQESEDALRRSEERLRLVYEATGLADFESLPGGTALFSHRFAEQCGLPKGTTSVSFEDWLAIIHPDDRETLQQTIEQALAEGRSTFAAEFRIVRPDNGETMWISSWTTMKRDEEGKVVRSIGAHLDITALRRSEEALRESEGRFRLAAEAAGLGVWDYDPATARRDWSGRLYEIFGLSEDIAPSPEAAAARIHPDDRSRFLRQLLELRDGEGAFRFATTARVIRGTDGAERWVSMNGWRTGKGAGRGRIILTFRDVTEEKTAEERIRWTASHDALTQLANRSSFQEQLRSAIQAARKSGGKVGMLMIDLDHFKQVNDALGHNAGDRLLQDFADRLSAAVRSSDTVARLSGDEFAILVPGLVSEESLEDLSNLIHDRLRDPFLQKGRVIDCRISVGTAIYPQHGTTPEELMISADMALYAAKRAGRATTIEYQPHLRDEVRRFASMVAIARNAVQKDRIIPYYQPKLDLSDGAIIGFEALLRWRDEKNDIRLPASIEAAFEDHEVAAAISDRMIEQAIIDMRRWLDKDVAFGHVAVNASAAEFRRDDFGERVLEQLRKADIPPTHFQLEVTETVFLGRGAEYVQRALALLSSEGVKIALDDFGTGYASLRHLKQFPVDILKIDQSFVRDMEDDPGDEAIIRAVVNLGKNLGIKVVAEGIETMSQAESLIELGCDYGQGFLFSKALPGNRVPSLVAMLPERLQGVRESSGRKLQLVSGGN